MAFPDSTWPCAGELSIQSSSTEEIEVIWDLEDYFGACWSDRKEIKSDSFSLAGATWNLFTSFYEKEDNFQFGINVRTEGSSDAEFNCRCNISFVQRGEDNSIKNIKFKFNCEQADTHYVAKNFIGSYSFRKFIRNGKEIVCRITIKKSSNKGTSSQIKSSTQTQLPKNVDEEILKSNPIYKVCLDLKQLLLSEEDFDVTFQVKDQQFKAHRLILKARSPVFAAIFHHDTKEKATGVVDVDDCEPSSFRVLLEFLYCGSIENLSVKNVFSLYKSAKKYNVEDLKMKCIEFMKNNTKEQAIGVVDAEDCEPSYFAVFLEFLYYGSTEKLSVENVFSIYTSADKYGVQELKVKCFEFIDNNLSVETFCKTVKSCLEHGENSLLKRITDFFAGNFKQIILSAKWQAFNLENPIQVNEILIKAFASDAQDH